MAGVTPICILIVDRCELYETLHALEYDTAISIVRDIKVRPGCPSKTGWVATLVLASDVFPEEWHMNQVRMAVRYFDDSVVLTFRPPSHSISQRHIQRERPLVHSRDPL